MKPLLDIKNSKNISQIFNVRNISACVLCFLGVFSLFLQPSVLSLIFCGLAILSVIVLLYIPSHLVEDGVGALSSKLKISSFIAGGIFLAAASSAPEFFSSFSGVVLHKVFDIGITIILWSALFNLCIIIGVCSFYKSPLKVESQIRKRDMPFYGASIILLVALAIDGIMTKVDFLFLSLFYFIYLGVLFFDKNLSYKEKRTDSWRSIFIKIALGIIAIAFLSHMLVSLGVQFINITESLFNYVLPVSLLAAVIFAPATSLSDLLMSISATKKGEESAAVVNGIASNTFDLTICLGVPGFIYTSMAGESILLNFSSSYLILILLIIAYLITYLFIYTGKRIDKWEGTLLNVYFIAALIVEIAVLHIKG